MRTINGPHIERIFNEGQYASLTKIFTKSQYFCSGRQKMTWMKLIKNDMEFTRVTWNYRILIV